MTGHGRRFEFLPVAFALFFGALQAQNVTHTPNYTPVNPARTAQSSSQATGTPGNTVARSVSGAKGSEAASAAAPRAAGSGTGSCSGLSLGNGASLNGFIPFPASNLWNTNIASAPVDPNSAAIVGAAGFAGTHLHPDFGSESYYGIPYVVVDSTITPSVPINVVDYAGESDVAVAPYPISAPIEGGPADCSGWPDNYNGDAHVLVLDRAKCVLYESFNTNRCNGLWNSSSETIWDMNNYESRPYGWTSADAAGLSIFAGLVRYDEVASGAIHHAIRFTLPHTKNDANGGYFVNPATHAAGTDWGVSNIMGMRIRLKASFDISGFSAANQVILTAMKQYGMILADNGSAIYFQGASDPRWNDSDLSKLSSVLSSNFEVVQMTPQFPGEDSATAPTGASPTINSFTASASSVSAGSPVTFTYSVSGDSYDYIDTIGPVTAGSGSVTIHPAATQTYTLKSANAFGGTTSTPITVTVPGSVVAPPIFTPPGGSYSSAEASPVVSISTTTSPSATIYYTTNGSTPTTQSAVFSISSPITVSATETLKAIAVVPGYAAPSAVGAASYTMVAAPQNQVIAFPYEPNLPLGTAPFTISATSMIYPTPLAGPASTNLTVSYASATPSVCTVSGTTVTLAGGGTCTIQATQAGNSTYAAAPPVSQSFQVSSGQQSQTINFGALVNQALGAAPFTISATASSGLAVSFASTTPPVCTVSGTTVTLVAVGTCTIQATQGGNVTYSAATPVDQSFQVTAPPAPTVQSVSPQTGQGLSGTFSAIYADTSGATAISTAEFLINSSLNGVQGCLVMVDVAHSGLYLLNDTGSAWQGPVTGGSAGTATNSQCTLNGPGSSLTASGTNLTLNLAFTFKAAFAGAKSVYGYAQTAAGLNSGWQTLGSWTVPASGGPSVVSVAPASGSGTSQTFSFTFSDTAGASDLTWVETLVNSTLNGVQACNLLVDVAHSGLYLLNDAGGAWHGPLTAGTAGTLTNSQCTVNGTGSSVTASGTTLTLNVSLTFKPVFAGARSIYGYAQTAAGLNTGWKALGSWTIPAGGPSVVSVAPASGSGGSQTFSFAFSDAAGASDLTWVETLINSSINGVQACLALVDVAHSGLYLLNDAGSAWQGPLTAGTAGTLTNSQCTMNGTGSSLAASGNNLTLNVALTFKTAFTGAKSVYGYAQTAGGLNTGWNALGSWTVAGGGPSVVSVAPASGSGSSQTFTFTFSDTAGASDLTWVETLVNSSLNGVQACLVLVDVAHSGLYLLNDAGSAWQGPVAAGAAGTVTNSQCTVNGTGSSLASSGNNLTLNVSVTFKPAFAGAKSVFGYAQTASGLTAGWQTLGSWTSQ